MSSFEPHNKMYTLTTLPLSIQTRILRYICPHHPFLARTNRWEAPYWLPFRDPPVKISLDCGEVLTVQLPSELIPPALASPVLAAAAANLLGDRVSYLTHCNTSGQLSAWITAFAPYVKAVSANDPFAAWWVDDLRGQHAQDWLSAFETQLNHSVQLFKTLSLDAVRLEVLDLIDVHFLDLSNMQDDVMAGLCATLENNSATLRELALPVFRTSDICDKALEMSTLKKLQVLTVGRWPMYVEDASEALSPPFLRMIRAVDGHADRSRKLTTLRELRFLNAKSLGYDYVTSLDRGAAVFRSVKTLRVVISTSEVAVLDDISLFMFLFKNLERLFWNINPGPCDALFEKLCTKVSEVHLCSSRWMTTCIQAGNKEHYGEKCSFFGESSSDSKFGSGAIRSVFAGAMPGIDVRTMMKHCPSLENVSVHVTRGNMRAIRKLLVKCQQIKCLELVFDERKHGRFDAEDWRSLSRSIPKSHKNLCQIAIQAVNHNAKGTIFTEAMFDCFETAAKALGGRARRLAFRAVCQTRRGVRIMERISGVLLNCLEHTPALESLELRLSIRHGDASNYDGDWEQRIGHLLANLETKILREVQSLRFLDLGIWPLFRQKLCWDGDTCETVCS